VQFSIPSERVAPTARAVRVRATHIVAVNARSLRAQLGPLLSVDHDATASTRSFPSASLP
jgi:hypothetical protein